MRESIEENNKSIIALKKETANNLISLFNNTIKKEICKTRTLSDIQFNIELKKMNSIMDSLIERFELDKNLSEELHLELSEIKDNNDIVKGIMENLKISLNF